MTLHLDHGKDIKTATMCINGGFTSVMIDGSHLDFEENIAMTKHIVNLARSKGVSVEAELGKLVSQESTAKDAEDPYTDPDAAVEFVNRTGVDSLAVAIGTSHGAYKFKGDVKLDFERLKVIRRKVANNGIRKPKRSPVRRTRIPGCHGTNRSKNKPLHTHDSPFRSRKRYQNSNNVH